MAKHFHVLQVSELHDMIGAADSMIMDGWIPCGGIFKEQNRYFQTFWRPPIPEHAKIALKRVAEKPAND